VDGWLGFRNWDGQFRKAILSGFVKRFARRVAVYACRRDDDECAHAALYIEQLIGMNLRKCNGVDQRISSVSQRMRQLTRLLTIENRDSRPALDQLGWQSTPPSMSDDNSPAVVQEIARNRAADLTGAS